MSSESISENQPVKSSDLSSVMVVLLKGVLYQDNDSIKWAALLNLQHQVRDYVAVLGLELTLDEAEGYAFLRTKSEDMESDESDEPPPRLIARRQLSFPVSLLLALLRKKLAEFDASGGETRLVLSKENIAELIRLFLPDSSNEAKLMDQIDRHINKVVELGFLRRLKSKESYAAGSSRQSNFEVSRIIKAFVDAQWLAEFDQKLSEYQQQLKSNNDE